MIRSILFQCSYWLTSLFFVVTALPLLLLPTRKPIVFWMECYARGMCFWMRNLAGVQQEVVGFDQIPEGPCILAAKHQSWGDGYFLFSQFRDLGFVIGPEISKYPFVDHILRKMGNVLIKTPRANNGQQQSLAKAMQIAKSENRKFLIFPEGDLSIVGQQLRYRRGVYYMYKEYNCPVVPVATNLGACWPRKNFLLNKGTATLKFLPPIAPGLQQAEFMQIIEQQIESHSINLIPEHVKKQLAHMPQPES